MMKYEQAEKDQCLAKERNSIEIFTHSTLADLLFFFFSLETLINCKFIWQTKLPLHFRSHTYVLFGFISHRFKSLLHIEKMNKINILIPDLFLM